MLQVIGWVFGSILSVIHYKTRPSFTLSPRLHTVWASLLVTTASKFSSSNIRRWRSRNFIHLLSRAVCAKAFCDITLSTRTSVSHPVCQFVSHSQPGVSPRRARHYLLASPHFRVVLAPITNQRRPASTNIFLSLIFHYLFYEYFLHLFFAQFSPLLSNLHSQLDCKGRVK